MEPFRTKTDGVFETLKEAIVRGNLRPGEWIRNTEWADRLGVSPIPVREALRRLEAQGLVEICAHRGARVTAQTEAHIAETYLIRISLESLAARQAMERVTDEEFATLVEEVEAATERLEKLLAADNSAEALRANFDIHMAIYRAAGMPRLAALIENLWATYPFTLASWPEDRRMLMAREHRDLLATLRERNPNKLAQAIEDHIRSAAEQRSRPVEREAVTA
jgi:DNA-binding GntR family transcriptional regulator